ncbi:MAG: hypothetical protein CMJ78_09510 [Planctomycetaceae bacterium]|nr:hypothetical protein [Planctomycetaceae bacterium]
MKKLVAILAIAFGLAIAGIAIGCFLHLRNIAFGSPTAVVEDHLDFRILTIGMIDADSTAPIDAAAFAGRLQFRVYMALGLGLGITAVGGVLMLPHWRSRLVSTDEESNRHA